MTERWKPVKNYAGIYEVSSFGNVRRVSRGPHTRPGKILKASIEHGGYRVFGLQSNGSGRQFRAARLVAIAFLEARKGCFQVNHKNGKKVDDRLENLEWVTPKQNIAHAVATGLAKPAKGAAHWRTTLSNADVFSIRAMATKGKTLTEISKIFKISRPSVSVIVSRKRWAHI